MQSSCFPKYAGDPHVSVMNKNCLFLSGLYKIFAGKNTGNDYFNVSDTTDATL